MFKRNTTPTDTPQPIQAVERITSVLGSGVVWHGSINGTGGVRIEGAFEGEISLRGMLVVGETGRVTCQNVRANAVIVAGAVRGNITTQKLEIRASGRVWGDVVTTAFVTEEGAFRAASPNGRNGSSLNLSLLPIPRLRRLPRQSSLHNSLNLSIKRLKNNGEEESRKKSITELLTLMKSC